MLLRSPTSFVLQSCHLLLSSLRLVNNLVSSGTSKSVCFHYLSKSRMLLYDITSSRLLSLSSKVILNWHCRGFLSKSSLNLLISFATLALLILPLLSGFVRKTLDSIASGGILVTLTGFLSLSNLATPILLRRINSYCFHMKSRLFSSMAWEGE